jgi:hypothetical protein
MPHSAELIFGVKLNRITPPIQIYFKTALAHEFSKWNNS